ncbi:hypothetical protein C6P45_000720 [Maudiozyma exigua]|uniref:Protein CAF130 n=1 Tax=Maudiozyma exigua TaxID=34358 RepID=A0A9P6W3W2_MAUEX|nr:hypothetical protein C6P45_000720 [Kazachstania exigua]
MEKIKINDMGIFKNFSPMHVLLKHEDYIPSINSLEKLFITDKYFTDEKIWPSLLLESSVIVLLTTKAGISILKSLHHIVYFSEVGDDLQKSLGKLKNWLSKNEKTNKGYINMKKDWINNRNSYLLKFLRFLIFNKDTSVNVSSYNNPIHKVSLSALFDTRTSRASLILDDKYNLLLDFIIFFQPAIDAILELTLRSFLLNLVIKSYKRTYEFNDKHIWLKFVSDNSYYDTVPTSYVYLATMPLTLNKDTRTLAENLEDLKKELPIIQNIELDEQDVDDINDIEFKNTPSDLTGMTNIEKWLHGILLKKQRYIEDPSGNTAINIQPPTTKEEISFSWDLDDATGGLKMSNMVQQTVARHTILARLLQLETLESPFLLTQFKIVSGLVDPLTQPFPNDEQVISIDLLHQMFIGLSVKHYEVERIVNEPGFDWRFLICFNMQKIINQSLKRLNCEDYERLASITNNTEEHWKGNLHKWLPNGMNTQDLELVYMINIMAVYTIYSLYSHLPIQMNPFLSCMIQLWKNLSCVILLGLEIDRLEEVHETFETPLMVRAALRGSAALRVVVATILNQHVEANLHDFKHEPFNTFMSPYGRKLCQGTLLADLRTHSAAMFALGCEIPDITDLLADLQAGDRFDEDIRYMFEYEYDDYNDSEYDTENGEASRDEADLPVKRRRCNCIFEDDKIMQEVEGSALTPNGDHSRINGDLAEDNVKVSDGQLASRMKSSFEFDYSGKDWRDVPRGFNLYFSPNYNFIQNPRLEDVYKLILKATTEKLNEEESKILLQSVASCVKIEQEQILIQNAGIDPSRKKSDGNLDKEAKLITPDDIYEIWCEESAFERMLYQNQELSWRVMDEMLMCNGYRRVLIWFITHTEINHSLIHYIFELSMGLRGQKFDINVEEIDKKNILLSELMVNEKDKKKDPEEIFRFSRQGNIILSEIENKMLLQEFFTSAAIYFATTDGTQNNNNHHSHLSNTPLDKDLNQPIKEGDNVSLYSIGLVKLICYMVQTLIKSNKFDFTKSECTFELQTLLMNWIGIIPEAQELFFNLKNAMAREEDSDDDDNDGETNDEEGSNKLFTSSNVTDSNYSEDQNVPKFNEMLLKLLPSLDKNKDSKDDEDHIAIATLTMFLHKHSLTHNVPIIGRKSLHYDDKILPLPEGDKPLGISTLLADDDNDSYYMESDLVM